MKRFFSSLLLPAVLLAAVSCGQNGDKKDAPAQFSPADVVQTVSTIVTSARDVDDISSYSSTVQPYAVNNIAPLTGGRITKINARIGDYVSRGQVLVEMDRIQLDQTRLQLQNDSTELSRLRALYAEGGLSASDMEAMELAYNVRKATYDNLEENTILRSPISGYITARNYDKGDIASAALPVFTVQQVIPVKLLVGISESEYTKVKKGDQVTLTVEAFPGREFEGKITRLYPTMDAATHTFNVEVVVENRDRALRPGMYARVTVKFGTNHRVVVPDRAVVKQEGSGQKYVFVLNDDSTVSYLPVTIGRHMGNEYEIIDGLDEGVTIISKGQSTLKEGSTVQVVND